jgi:hypothetical protein
VFVDVEDFVDIIPAEPAAEAVGPGEVALHLQGLPIGSARSYKRSRSMAYRLGRRPRNCQ